jgi:hypothetical protein
MQKPLIKTVAGTKHQAMLSEANGSFVAVYCQVSNDKNGHGKFPEEPAATREPQFSMRHRMKWRCGAGAVVSLLFFVIVSVRRVLESYGSTVIQEWWPDSRRGTDVDKQ